MAEKPSRLARGLTVNGSLVGWNQTQHCRLLDGMVPDQLHLCKRNLELMQSIVQAAKLTKVACQKTFSDMRWNCSSVEHAPYFTPDLEKALGEKMLRRRLRDGLPKIALIDSLQTKCKCHGVSGSCSVKTCWRSLQDLGEVAEDLKAKYLGATKVMQRHMGTRKQLVPRELDVRPVRETELVYLVSSPDYCTKNEKQGSYGTQDRQCNRTSVGSDSCNLMCCGRGYNTYTETLVERCQCKYHWCCYVTCKRCERAEKRYLCK
nr:PREDICTED: protein Wnt-11b-like [Latimeria chalumnae]|eukprot:XP_014344527.1 PREDICTED: protein Wnt-11b-like [Latimeria chalumnae]